MSKQGSVDFFKLKVVKYGNNFVYIAKKGRVVTPQNVKLCQKLFLLLYFFLISGAVTITPKDQMHHQHNFATNVNESPWFSILPIGNPVDHQARLIEEAKDAVNPDTLTPQINALEAKLDQLKSLDLERDRALIPGQ